ncbi:thymidylate synthase [uncultured Jatrophihabitans sp.]|uniref:thymidylate synthase n=1 Tax=uncultured Jatrophihabitans sp. TaxID=1610747 RepID=UPI0035C96FFE
MLAPTITCLRRPTIGEAWLAVAECILADGTPGSWDGKPLREILAAVLEVDSPAVADPIIARHADPERLAWMHANFTDHSRVAELGEADSYATRLYDYARTGRDQIAWVVERIKADPATRNATITTFQPLTDTSYVPCVSLLDFWLAGDALQLGVYAHGIDFGTKGYANLVELAALQHHVADAVGAAVGTFTFTIKSAHIYDTELDLMRDICRAAR